MRAILLITAFAANIAWAADIAVPINTGTVDCDTFGGGVGAGDRLIVEGGNWSDWIRFRDCVGLQANPIQVINDPTDGQVIMDNPGSNWVIDLDNSQHIVFDATGDWVGKPAGSYCGVDEGGTEGCGWVLRAASSSDYVNTYFKFSGSPRDYVTIKGFEIDGLNKQSDNGPQIAIQTNDGTDSGGGTWQENIVIEENYIHDTGGEAMYLGPWNFEADSKHLRNITVRNNLMVDIGLECVQIKSGEGGNNLVYGNWCINAGSNPSAGNTSRAGISHPNGDVDTYDNFIIRPGQACIYYNSSVTQAEMTAASITGRTSDWQMDAWNNLCVEPGTTWPSQGHGVMVAPESGSNEIDSEFYNNTVVDSTQESVYIGSRADVVNVYNNILCGYGTGAIDGTADSDSDNLKEADCADVGFNSYASEDFSLDSGSSAVDPGALTGAPSTDIIGISRPQGSSDDQGAYEFSSPSIPTVDPFTAQKPSPCCATDAGATYYPDHLWYLDEGTGSTLTDEGGNGTDEDLTITGADWETDSNWSDSPVLSCVSANSDYAENTTFSLSGTVVYGAIINPDAPSSFHFPMSLADASEAETFSNIKWNSSSNLSAEANFEGTVATNTSAATGLSSGEYYLVMVRVSDSTVDISVNGADWDTLSISNSGMVAALDAVSLCRRGDSSPSGYFDGDIYAAFIERGDISDPSAVWNNGDPWSELGIINSGSEENPPARGTFGNSGLVQ